MDEEKNTSSQEILPACTAGAPLTSLVSGSLPEIIRSAGPAATFAWDEFFAGHIRNPHTRAAYLYAVRRFLSWAESRARLEVRSRS